MGCILPPPAPEQGSLLERYWASIAVSDERVREGGASSGERPLCHESDLAHPLRLLPFDPCEDAPTLRPAAPPTLRAEAPG